MLSRFDDYIATHLPLLREGKVLLAVSGGRDSVAMTRLASEARLSFAIAHCNFHLRGDDSDRDQHFVAGLAASLGVAFHTVDFDTRAVVAASGESVEEAARRLRYSWFASLCSEHGYRLVATAHHRDDSVETFFLNLFRGTGIAGLHGIRPLTEHAVAPDATPLLVARPMLCFTRADIDRYVADNHLVFVEDRTNRQLDARRNQIRQCLMPLLRQMYPSVDDTMAANIERLHDAEMLYNDRLAELRTQLVVPYRAKLPTMPVAMQCIRLADLPEPRATILFELLRHYGFNAAAVASMLADTDACGRLFQSPSHVAEVHNGMLLLVPAIATKPPSLTFDIVAAGADVSCRKGRPCRQEVDKKGGGDIDNDDSMTECLDADLLHQPLSLRPWRDGDRFRPLGMHGSRLVSDFLKDSRLSLIERRHVHLLVDADDTPLWVVGLRIDDRFRLTASTTSVLRVTVGTRKDCQN